MDKQINLNSQELEKLALYLQKNVGIHLEEHKLKRFKTKIEDIFVKYKIDDFNTFYHKLRFLQDEDIKQDLINAVTVNETYFWREHEQFEVLSKKILPKIVKNQYMPKVRILVSPCSSGEELYSIMLSILDSGELIEKAYFELVGIDVDTSMIRKAKLGVYDKRSVSKLPKNLLDNYFTKDGFIYKIDKDLKENATFMQANIFDESLKEKLGSFDVVFSRNMLIYFNQEDKQRCYEQFYKLLKSKSYLFLGHADSNGIDKSKFIPLEYNSHIYIKNL